MRFMIAVNLANILLGVVGSATITAAARAETIALKADLKGTNGVPPNNSTAPAKAEAKLATETRLLTYAGPFAGLSGPVLGAHFHGPGEAGKNAGIALPFKTVQSP